IEGPGLALDDNLPFLTNVSSNQYFLLQIVSYRGSDTNNTGFTRVLFTINSNPDLSGLNVKINPSIGEALHTRFDIDCSGAADDDGILGYYVGFATRPNAEMSQCSWINSRMISSCSITSQLLPAGLPGNGNKVWICIKAYDTIYSYSFASNFSVTVTTPAVSVAANPNFLREKENVINSGSLSDLVSFASVAATCMNQPTAGGSGGNGSTEAPISQQQSQEELDKAITIRRDLMVAIKKTLPNQNDSSTSVDAGEVRSTLDCLRFLTSKPDEINDESVNVASDIIDSQAKFLIRSSTDPNTGASDIANAVGPLIEASSNLLKAGDKNQKRSGGNSGTSQKQQKPNTKLLGTISAGASAISNKQVVGEKPTVLVGGDLSLSVSKSENYRLKNAAVEPGRKSDCGRVKFGQTKRADGSELFSKYNPQSKKFDKAPYVSTQFTTMNNNMFAVAQGGANLTSNVFMLNTQDGASGTTEPFKITETAPDSEIEILISTRDDKTGTETTFMETLPAKDKMRVQIAEVTPDQGLFVKLTRFLNYTEFLENSTESNVTVQIPQRILMNNYTFYEGEFEFHVYMRVGQAPTDQAFDYFCKLPLGNPPNCTNSASTDSGSDGTGDASTNSSNPAGTTATSRTTTTATPTTTTTSSTTTTGTASSSDSTEKCANRWERADRWTCFLPPEMLAVPVGKEKIYIGVRALRLDMNETGLGLNSSTFRRIPSGVRFRDNMTSDGFDMSAIDPAFYVVVGYESLIFSTGCRFYNETSNSMESTGVRLGQCSNPYLTQCFTRHLTSFMSSFYVPPIQFDPNDSGWLKLDSNPIALALVLSLVCFYFLVIIWASKKDREDVTKVGVTPLPDNDPRDEFEYELTFWTGARGGAGTTANVSLILSGDEGDTLPRLIRDPQRLVLQRGATDSFLMRTPVYLGRLTHMRLWHDNAGSSPNWYFSRLLVHDLQTGDKYYFISNRWFAIDEDDGMVDRIIALSGKEEINGFENVFWTRSQKNLYDGHLWFSVVTRPARSKFTRCQRATACLCLLMSTMMVNLMFYNQSQHVESPKLIEIGPVKFTPHSIYIATVSTLIILPVNVLIVLLFKNRRDRVVVKKGFERGGEMERGAAERRRIAAAGRADSGSAESVDASQARRDMEHSLDASGRLDTDDVSVGMAADKTQDKKSIPLSHLKAAHPDQFGAMPDAVSQSNLRADTTGEHKKGVMSALKSVWSKIFPLPWWSYYIGYGLSFATVAVCTYLMVEFANVLGEAKTAEWLASMAVTLLQSIV
uniref:PLAT domain-containing protein n=1 Tax=Macrostomum lignano TaxID=282301 RepID=A0A1I8G815_9PLAT